MDKRFIEESFPVKLVSIESVKEKTIRKGHISTLHIWWARRPLASSRLTSYTSLIPTIINKKIFDAEKKFIAEFAKWKNCNNDYFIANARKNISNFYKGQIPKVLDPFGGGGSIPLELLRLGCNTFSNDLNPIAALIQKCTIEYPQKYGKPGYVLNKDSSLLLDKPKKSLVKNKLIADVDFWGEWVIRKVKSEIGHLYPNDNKQSVPLGYLWARTINCPNPHCKIEIPLMRQYWLANKKSKKIALYPLIENRKLLFKIVGTGYDKMPKDFNPSTGTIRAAITICPNCGYSVKGDEIRKLFFSGKASERLLAIVTHNPNENNKSYRLPNNNDLKVFNESKSFLETKRAEIKKSLGIDPLPDEFIHTPDNKEYKPNGLLYNFTPVLLYGMVKWRDLFNYRQKLMLMIISDNIRQAYTEIYKKEKDPEYSKVITSYLTLNLGRMLDKGASLCIWSVTDEYIAHVFGRQALSMTWDYVEMNPFSQSTGDWLTALGYIKSVIENCSKVSDKPAVVTNVSATELPYEENYFDAIFTDPPYYDNVPYSDLSDFFYVWYKRVLGSIYPELFTTPLTPKKNEAIAELPLLRGMNKLDAIKIHNTVKTKETFETLLKNSFKEFYRVLKSNGIAVIVYAHKSTEGWETLINSLLESNLVITAAWPLNTEMAIRLRARESAALASSIYIVCRKIDRLNSTLYSDTKEELKKYLSYKLDTLWNEGITGADFFIAAIGASIEVFGKYKSVIDYEGKQIKADRLLQDVRVLVTDYAVRKILHNGFASEISDLTRFYILFRWEFGIQKVEFDEANKLTHSCHIDLAEEWTKKSSFIKKDKEFISILGPQDRDIEDLEESSELIDVLHLSLKYWEKNRKAELNTLLRVSGFGKSDAFFRVAQAIAETLPQDNKEKKLLEGFLNLREKIILAVSEPKTKYDQGKLEFPENE